MFEFGESINYKQNPQRSQGFGATTPYTVMGYVSEEDTALLEQGAKIGQLKFQQPGNPMLFGDEDQMEPTPMGGILGNGVF